MNSFPVIPTVSIQGVFDSIHTLYNGDKLKIIEAAQRATAGDVNPIVANPGAADPQIGLIRNRLSRTADNYGRGLLVRLVEELHNDLSTSGAIGVHPGDFLTRTVIKVTDNSFIKFNADSTWSWNWVLSVDDNPREVTLGIRAKNLNPSDVVPSYILEYVHQAYIAYNQNRPGAALSLMSISLEGTLRDALNSRGITYNHFAPREDVYSLEEMHIHKNPNGFMVTFPNPKPLDHNHYLSNPGDPTFRQVRIKRFVKNGSFGLEIRDCTDVLDYWSASVIEQHGVRQVSGLGAALDIGRNHENIIQPIDLPPDIDRMIQTVRNNLIHLSGTAMTTEVQPGITLAAFLKDKNRVFDSVCTMGDTIGVIYKKLATGTL